MKYKLLVLDVDGTLLNEAKEISKRTLAALLKVQHMGVRIVLASGRPTYGLLSIAKTLELGNFGGFIVSYNGCQIINAQDGKILFERRINPEMLPYLEKKAQKNGFDLVTYQDNTLITNAPENDFIRKEAKLNDLIIIDEEEFSTSIDFAPCKCVLVSDDEEALIDLENHWKKRLDGTLDAFRSESYFLEVVPPGVDKANTLGVLMEQLGVAREEVIAIGDGVCDVTMLQLAGLGIAMGHSQDSVKVCADYVTASNEEDGVAQAVEKMILAEVHAAEIPLDLLNERARHALMGNLGIQYTYASKERIEATMPVDYRTRQPFGILHGGATLALAETVAGLGSMIICQPDEIVVGMQVSGNHISSAHEGDTVRAVGTIVHKGHSSHVWNVDVFTSTNKLVSSVRVVNSVMKKR
ncbi:Cof-type HAD-IIB family hydrolase [Bacteroides fluxus]|jgi:Cof subfamily protein (haloacid dehalogenase superfamily)|uniref:Cof-type HAD-IIB family hydrolase n=1 Tax=Bacteroides fluxus TaxID=626930 RepID=UPI00235294A7|nr:Cof-type HAD-IIB family hydrolase [Bacteroides fluxus]MDY3788963.1 Cof-type HAD-IIB family hydrolase [Bacteroides fluxus]